MRQNAFFSNRGYARKGITILIDAMVMFETVERSVDHGSFGEWPLGFKFNDTIVYPAEPGDLDKIRTLVRKVH